MTDEQLGQRLQLTADIALYLQLYGQEATRAEPSRAYLEAHASRILRRAAELFAASCLPPGAEVRAPQAWPAGSATFSTTTIYFDPDDGGEWKHMADTADDAARMPLVQPLYAAPVAPAVVPEGWKLAPMVPTDAMMKAASELYDDDPSAIYEAMLSAAPAPMGNVSRHARQEGRP
jgi:hypothetical protein